MKWIVNVLIRTLGWWFVNVTNGLEGVFNDGLARFGVSECRRRFSIQM